MLSPSADFASEDKGTSVEPLRGILMAVLSACRYPDLQRPYLSTNRFAALNDRPA